MGHDLRPDVVCVADGGATSGLGHLSRTGAVAVALRLRGLDVSCIALGADEPLVHDVEWRSAASLGDAPAPHDGGALVVDSYVICPADARAAAGGAALVLLSETHADDDHADLVVSTVAQPGRRRLAGLRYACLRPAFWGIEPEDGDEERIAFVLVTTGSTSTPGELATAIESRLPKIDVKVVGRCAPAGSCGGVARVVAPALLLELILAAHIVVTAAGQTLLETLACGRPAVTLVTAENQRRQAQLVAAADCAVLVDPPDADAIADAVACLAQSAAVRSRIAANGSRLVDGLGATRVAFAIDRLVRRSG